MPYMTPTTVDTNALPLPPFDFGAGQIENMTGAPVEFGPFPDDGQGLALVRVFNLNELNSEIIVWVRGDGTPTAGDDGKSVPVFPESSEVFFLVTGGRKLSIMAAGGRALAMPYKADV